MRFSVVVATYNRKALLRRCLTALSNQALPAYEIIVVDDASTDGTGQMVQTEFPRVRYLRLDENRGPAAARNRGVAAATGDVVAFTDDDCIVPYEWLARLADGYSRHPEVVGVSGFQIPPAAVQQTNPVARAQRIMRQERWGTLADAERVGGDEIPGFGTNNASYRRDVLLELGGFDEWFPLAAGEDADLQKRVADAGYRLLYIPLAVDHLRDYTLSAQWQMSVRRGVGAYYFEVKHSSKPSLSRLLLRLGKRTALFARGITRHDWRIAYITYLTHLGDWMGQFQTALNPPPEIKEYRR